LARTHIKVARERVRSGGKAGRTALRKPAEDLALTISGLDWGGGGGYSDSTGEC